MENSRKQSARDVRQQGTLGDRLAAARRATFVGRAAECDRFERMLDGNAEPVWFLYGPGGIGKTTLLAELARRADSRGRIVIEIDARHLIATPTSWQQALREALSVEASAQDDHVRPLSGSVLLVDTFETIGSLERWLREEELPHYPDDVLVVFAGRARAAASWHLDPGWSSISSVSRMSPWTSDEASEYLKSRLGDTKTATALVSGAAGIPLMLALLVDAQRRGHGFVTTNSLGEMRPADAPEFRDALLRELLVRFGRDLADPILRAALDVLTVARTVTVPMLAETVDANTASETYDWLASLPFVEEGEAGLQMHDAVRDAFAGAWIARDPDAIARAGLRVQQHLCRRAPLLARNDATRQLKDWFFVLRYTEVGRYMDYRAIDEHLLAKLQTEQDEVLALVRRRLGSEMTAIVQHWIAHRPHDFTLVKHRSGKLAGVALLLELTEISAETMAVDPAVSRAWAYVQRERPRRPGASVVCFRLVLDAEGDELPNPTVTLIGTLLTERTLLNPKADWNIIFQHNFDAIEPLQKAMTRINWTHRIRDLDNVVGGHHFAAAVRDYVREPVGLEWRPTVTPIAADAPPPLGADDFEQALRDVLRQFSRDDALASNPLRYAHCMGSGGAAADISVLRQVVSEAIDQLSNHPNDRKFHRALKFTWLIPGAKQEAVASELGLPFNTYRYHLARGAQRLAQVLWQREIMARR
jgi:hypothetical protein